MFRKSSLISKPSERDLDFLVETAFPGAVDKVRLKEILREDVALRNSFVGDEKIFRRLMGDEEIFLKISPALFFEILLRKVVGDLKGVSFTVERAGTGKIPVFDTKEVVNLLTQEPLLLYLADMLSSFTRIESYAISFQVRKGIWEKIRFNDLDLFSLIRFSEAVDEKYRLGFYRRIADICLFILGIFPEYAERDYRYPFSGQIRPQVGGNVRISPEEYEEEGRKFYRLAAGHQSARDLDLSEVFMALCENFQKAKKPLNFIADHYLHSKKNRFFA